MKCLSLKIRPPPVGTNQDGFPCKSRLPWFFKLDLFDTAEQRVKNPLLLFIYFKLCWTCLRSRGNQCLRLQSCFDSFSNSWVSLLFPCPSPGAHKNRSPSSTCHIENVCLKFVLPPFLQSCCIISCTRF